MTRRPAGLRTGPARHERPAIDEAALGAARHADRLLDAARRLPSSRWADVLSRVPDSLRDGDLAELRATAMRARAAFGPRDSIRDALPDSVTEPFRESVDRLLKVLARHDLGDGA
ncbi:MAG TPA: hypothetical protein VNF73_12065 [Candidatus Saccharimonadales bacterium]|nr:hypothetical protein [Candidatus Saccharimonadales bacterium]